MDCNGLRAMCMQYCLRQFDRNRSLCLWVEGLFLVRLSSLLQSTPVGCLLLCLTSFAIFPGKATSTLADVVLFAVDTLAAVATRVLGAQVLLWKHKQEISITDNLLSNIPVAALLCVLAIPPLTIKERFSVLVSQKLVFSTEYVNRLTFLIR